MIIKRILIISLLIISKMALSDGFIAGTLIKTPTGYKTVENLTINDEVISFDCQKKIFLNDVVVNIEIKHSPTLQKISYLNRIVLCDTGQKFYCKIEDEFTWKKSALIQANELLKFSSEKPTLINIDTETLNTPSLVYVLSTKKYHNFLVTEHDLLAHNFVLSIPILAWLGANVEFTISFLIGGLCIAGILHHEKILLPGQGKGWIKLKGDQGWLDENGNSWKKDKKHQNHGPHWDVSDRKGKKIKEVDYDGNEIWPNGPKNKNKKP